MYLFQFGLATEPEPVLAVPQGDLFIPAMILAGVTLLLLAIVGLFIARFFIRRMSVAKQATFRRVTLLITLPKFKRIEDSERGATKDSVQEAISAAETFYSAIAGLTAQRGLKAWLYGRRDEISFEIVAEKRLVKFLVTIPYEMRELIEQQLSAAYSDAYTEEVEDYNLFQPEGVILGSHLILKRHHAFPIKTYKQLDTDPLNAITNVLSQVPDGEGAAFQFIVRSSYAKWRRKGVWIASNMQQGMKLEDAIRGKKKGKSSWLELAGISSPSQAEPEKDHRLSPQEEQVVKGIEEKASKGGLDVCIRLVVSAQKASSAETLMQNMLSAFAQYNIYQYGNSFDKVVPRSKKKIITNFIYRSFDERRKLILNTEEMASLWHLPLPWTDTPNIQWLGARKGPVPSDVPVKEPGSLHMGFNNYRGVKTDVYMKSPDRSRHMYLIGKSGSGKSQTMAKYIIEDIKNGHGVALVEPHGDLVEQVLGNIPKERIDDVIVFDPSDLGRPLGINLLEAPTEEMRDFAVQEMISIFYKLFPPEMIGPMFEHTMRNMMLTLMADINNPGTIAEVPRLVTDEKFQKEWRAKLTDPVVKSYWENEVDNTSDYHKSEMFGYITSKVGRFVENEMMRNIIGQQRSSFDFREVMDKKKILLVNLSKGKTGDVNAEMLGLVIVSKLQMAALGRADMAEEDREDFYLYIDEFQNFITDSIAVILSEARKYRLNLIIAHQYIGQLVKNNDASIKEAVFGNVGTMYVARIGPEDVDTLEKIFEPYFKGYDLINSDKYTWYVKMIADNSQLKPFTMNIKTAGNGDPELATAIKQLSRLKYGRDVTIVAEEIMERTQVTIGGAQTGETGASSK